MKAGVAVPVLAFAWIVAGALSPRADDGYRGLFCTMKGEDGHVYTVNLRVPKSGGGSCDLVDVVRVVISEPRPVHAIPTIDPNGPINWSRPDPPSPPGDLTRLPAARKLWSMFIVPREIGTLKTSQGIVYPDCRLLAFQTDGVIVLNGDGISKILDSDLDASSLRLVKALP